jgi:hypothetical protein
MRIDRLNPFRLIAVLIAAGAFFGGALPARAQVDLNGNWEALRHEDWQDRDPGPEAVNYLGIPLNDEARARALSYSSSALSLPERQCMYYAPHYLLIGPFGPAIWSEINPSTGETIAWHIASAADRAGFTIWMDNRPEPSEGDLHSIDGFSSGRWDGSTLRVHTTNFKEGYLRRNGVPTSDRAVIDMTLKRHLDLLTITMFIQDPVYLTEPFVLSRTFRLDTSNAGNRVPGPCIPQAEIPSLVGDGKVPNYLPGKNPGLNDATNLYNIPLDAVLGGADTMYPEFREKLKAAYQPPEKCTRYCCGWEDNMNGFPNCPGRNR